MSDIDWDATIQEVQRGWGKGTYGGCDSGRYSGQNVCMIGALCVANRIQLFQADTVASRYLSPVILEQFPERAGKYGYVPTFNDHPDTTLEDVILVLEKARAHG